MRLLLARHAKAVSDGDWVSSDEARHLKRVGRQHAIDAGQVLGSAGEVLDAVLTSPLTRTVQTAELMARGLGWEGVIASCAPLEPGGRLSRFLDALASFGDDARVLAVGHEPQMSEWCAKLLGVPTPPRVYHPGTVLVLEFPGVAEPGKGRAVLHFGREGLETL